MIASGVTHEIPQVPGRYGKEPLPMKPNAEFAIDLLKKKAEKRKIHFSHQKAGLLEKSTAWSVACNPNIIFT